MRHLIGQKYGRLEILSTSKGKLGAVKCQCRCACGKEKEIRFYVLENSIVSSCGCREGKKAGRKAGIKDEVYVSPVESHLARKDHLKRNHPMLYYSRIANR